MGGAVDTDEDLARHSPAHTYVDQRFDPVRAGAVRKSHPDHCLISGTHIGPFTAAYMAVGFERFFLEFIDRASQKGSGLADDIPGKTGLGGRPGEVRWWPMLMTS